MEGEDEIDRILKETRPYTENKYTTKKFWVDTFKSIYMFIYFFVYSLIFPVDNPNSSSSNNNLNNAGQNNNQQGGYGFGPNQRRPPGFRYRSRGGG